MLPPRYKSCSASLSLALEEAHIMQSGGRECVGMLLASPTPKAEQFLLNDLACQ